MFDIAWPAIVQETAARYIRQNFFFPLEINALPEKALQREQNLLDPEIFDPCHLDKPWVWNHIEIQEETVTVWIDDCPITFHLRHYQTKGATNNTPTLVRIGGNDETMASSVSRVYPLLSSLIKKERPFRITVTSFYDTYCEKGAWEPKTLKDLGQGFSLLLESLDHKYHCTALMVHSVGGCILDAMMQLHTPLPDTLLLDRTMASTEKTAAKLYSKCFAPVLQHLLTFFGWDSNLEQTLVKQNCAKHIYLLTIEHDNYFSNEGDFDPSFVTTLKEKGTTVYFEEMSASCFEYHKRTFHSLPLDTVFFKENHIFASTALADFFLDKAPPSAPSAPNHSVWP